MFTRIRKGLVARRDVVVEGELGFSLIELLVVVIVIGILAAIAVPVYLGMQAQAKDGATQSDLANIKIAVVSYNTKNTPSAPPALDVATLGSYGFTKSVSYSSDPAFKTGSTVQRFCIDATSPTGVAYYVSSNSGVTKGSCSATTTVW